jgi:hypothetical protein
MQREFWDLQNLFAWDLGRTSDGPDGFVAFFGDIFFYQNQVEIHTTNIMLLPTFRAILSTKGQLISKCLFGTLNLHFFHKKRTKKYDLTTSN